MKIYNKKCGFLALIPFLSIQLTQPAEQLPLSEQPDNVILEIGQNLSYRNLTRLMSTSRRMYNLLRPLRTLEKYWSQPDIKKMLVAQGSFYPIAISPDGKLLASGDEDGKILVWNIEYKNRIKSIGILKVGDSQELVGTIAFSPDGKLLAAGTWWEKYKSGI